MNLVSLMFMVNCVQELNRNATLDDIPDKVLDGFMGKFDYVWFLGVWQVRKIESNVLTIHADWNKIKRNIQKSQKLGGRIRKGASRFHDW
jgi:hypothetical protein